MNNKIIVGLVVLLVGVGAGWYFLRGNTSYSGITKTEESSLIATTPSLEPTVTLGSEDSATGGVTEKGGVSGSALTKTSVSYRASGFTPNIVTVKKGTPVVWTNQSQSGMWVASAMHPTHQLLPGFDQLKSVANGGTYDYTFMKVGTWKYHNHVQASDFGTVVVTE